MPEQEQKTEEKQVQKPKREVQSTLAGEEKEKLLKLSEISLWIDTYDDIFSDFDPRPYNQRAISDDFLNELMKATRSKTSGKTEIRFLVPAKIRSTHQEAVIKKRLQEYFHRRISIFKQEKKELIIHGLRFTGIGIALMIFATLLLSKGADNVLTNFLIILLEPAGWFLFWNGMDALIYRVKAKKPEFEFNKNMAKTEVTFVSY